MSQIQKIYDAKNSWAIIVDCEPNLMGHEYTFNALGGKVIKDAIDQTDAHYFERAQKPPIPKGTELIVDCWWKNFYGSYFRVKYEGNTYDVSSSCIELHRIEEK